MTITQQRIDLFAEATDDHQWIHTDPERAKESPFGTTIAHGMLTLSLSSALLRSALTIDRLRMGVNYGFNRVRVVSPVPCGAAIRARFTLEALEQLPDAVQATGAVVVEVQGRDRPAAVAAWVTRYYVQTEGNAREAKR